MTEDEKTMLEYKGETFQNTAEVRKTINLLKAFSMVEKFLVSLLFASVIVGLLKLFVSGEATTLILYSSLSTVVLIVGVFSLWIVEAMATPILYPEEVKCFSSSNRAVGHQLV